MSLPGRIARRLSQNRKRLWKSVSRHGVRGTAHILLDSAAHVRRDRRRRSVGVEFDRQHGVDTAGTIDLGALTITSPAVALGNKYEPSAPDLFRRTLSAMPIEFERFTFVDVGAGKGRTLLLASELPFRRIVGVEFSPELVSTAQANVAHWLRGGRARCREIEVVCDDAVGYQPPDDPLVVYFYNPFLPEVMRAVLENLRRSLREHPRPMLLVLAGDASLVGETIAAGFTEIDAGPYRVFTTPQAVESGSALLSPFG
jgi:SAM-dependent methyltransferase